MEEDFDLTKKPTQLAGNAFIWQVIQMGSVKVIFLVRVLVLARLLTPMDFGLVAIASTAMGFLLNMTNFGMIPALVQGKEMDDAQYNAAWTIGIVRSLLITVVMIVAAPLIASIFAEPKAVPIIRVLAFIPLLEAFSSIKVASLNRNLVFRPLAMLRLVNAFVHVVVSIVISIQFGVWGLVSGMLAGAATMAVGSYFMAPHRPKISFEKESILPLIHFGRWIFITSLIVMAGSSILRVVISRQLGPAGLGLYYLASQLAFMPAEVASEVVGNVAFPLFSRLQNDITQAKRVFRAIFLSLAALLYPICALIMILAPGLTNDILGPKWEGTAPVIRVLAFVTMIGILGEVVVPVLKGFGQPYRITLIELVQSTMIIGFVWILTEQFGLVGAAMAWLPAVSTSQFLNIFFIRQILHHPFSGLQRPLIVVLMVTGVSTAIAGVFYFLIPGVVGVLLGIVSAVLAAISLLWVSDRHFSLGFMHNLAWFFPEIAGFLNIPLEKK